MNASKSDKKVGLIFGKFYPLHRGHIYLIEASASYVDELHVFLGCESLRDQKLFEQSKLPKQPQVSDRYNWLKESFLEQKNIIIHILDEAGIEYYPNGWQDWSQRVLDILDRNHIKPNVVFTSEEQDNAYYEQYFNCEAMLIDAKRSFIDISATKIRQAPYQNWHYLAKNARPFFVKKVIISDDKSNILLKKLANVYATNYVIYYNESQTADEFIKKALAFSAKIDKALLTSERILLLNTDFDKINQQFEQKYNQKSAVLQELAQIYKADLVLNHSQMAGSFDKALKEVSKILN